MKPAAVLFDLDGTLVDSLADLATAVNRMLASFDRAPLSPERIRLLIGRGARNLVQGALESRDPQLVETGLARFLEYNRNHIADRSRLYPGVRDMLEALEARGIPMATISNKNESLSRLILAALGIDSHFRIVCGGDSFEEMKPSPLPLLRVTRKLAVPPERTVMVGDSINDIQAGRLAGITTIGCGWGYGVPEELREADHLAGSCDELVRILLGETP